MRLLNAETLEFKTFFETERPPYVILSHRWLGDETTLQDFQIQKRLPDSDCPEGVLKVRRFCQQVFNPTPRQEWLSHVPAQWVWIDTCCIDKTSSAELTEAINSMFRWYHDAICCFVYLHDVQETDSPELAKAFEEMQENEEMQPYYGTSILDSKEMSYGERLDMHSEELNMHDQELWDNGEGREIPPRESSVLAHGEETEIQEFEEHETHVSEQAGSTDLKDLLPRLKPLQDALASSSYWKRGWTLQEFIAPTKLLFFDVGWTYIGNRDEKAMRTVLREITRIDGYILGDIGQIRRTPIALRMSWASDRKTSRTEDLAYCLLGIFNVHLPLIYGEGANAFQRLQKAIIETSDDESIFCWETDYTFGASAPECSMLAAHPHHFSWLAKPDVGRFSLRLLYSHDRQRPPYRFTNKGLEFTLFKTQRGMDFERRVPLNAVLVSNDGEQLTLGVEIQLISAKRYMRVNLSHLQLVDEMDPVDTAYTVRLGEREMDGAGGVESLPIYIR